jgi:hypothetical protein
MKALANAYLFGCIVRNGDMHAKNFSMEYKEGKYILSPVYDMVNTDVYGDYSALALPLGGENSPKPSKIIGFLSDYLSVGDFESMAMSVKSNLKDCSERAFAETAHKNAPKFQKKLEQSISQGINLVRGAIKIYRSGSGGIENSLNTGEDEREMDKKSKGKDFSSMTNEDLYKQISLFMPPDKHKEFLEVLEKKMKNPDNADELMSLAMKDKARMKHFNELLHINKDKLSTEERQFGESFLRIFNAHEAEERRKLETTQVEEQKEEEKPIERYSLLEERREEKERHEKTARNDYPDEKENDKARTRDIKEEAEDEEEEEEEILKEPEEVDVRQQSTTLTQLNFRILDFRFPITYSDLRIILG